MNKKKSKKALFVLHEGIGSTIFNSQVLVHANGMKDLGVDFDLLSYDTLSKTWLFSNDNLKKIKEKDNEINIFLKKGMNIYYPFSTLYNLIILIGFFIRNKEDYSFIHARADYTAFLCILAKPFHKLPVYWDCRGASVSELKDSLSRKSLLVRWIGNLYLVPFDQFAAYINCKKCDGAIFVSKSLLGIFKNRLKTENYKIIPCPVSEKKFFFDAELRKKMRSKLNILDTDAVYLYSGSMIAYQSLQEQYLQYEKLLRQPNNMVIIATSDPEVASAFFGKLKSDRLIIISVSFDEMNAYYNLADFAFLMRENKQLNYVASPTKFGEYCLTGLPVIMNDTVEQAFEIANLLGNYISYKKLNAEPFPDAKRANIAVKSQQYYSREVLNLNYMKLYKSSLEF